MAKQPKKLPTDKIILKRRPPGGDEDDFEDEFIVKDPVTTAKLKVRVYNALVDMRIPGETISDVIERELNLHENCSIGGEKEAG
jgi:hypothetical protein